MKHSAIRFRVDKTDYSTLDNNPYGWKKTVYGDVTE